MVGKLLLIIPIIFFKHSSHTCLTPCMIFVRFDKNGKVYGWLGGIFSCFNFIYHLYERPSNYFQGDFLEIFICFNSLVFLTESEWSELSEQSAIFCMQGRRPGNEDRAVIKRVDMVEDIKKAVEDVHIWAVMDGQWTWRQCKL